MPGKPASESHSTKAQVALGIAVLCVSFGASFVRFAESQPLATAAWRMTFATIAVSVMLGRGWRSLLVLTRTQIALGITAGLFLALHFATWITSLSHTTVASSVVLVNTAPVWVAVLSPFITREHIKRNTWTGMLLSFIGIVVIAGSDFRAGGEAMDGDLLALAGGLCLAMYILVGRKLMSRLFLAQYCTITYAAAACVLWSLAMLTGTKMTGFGWQTWASLLAMTLVSQIGGHTLYNWSLKHLPASFVSVALMGEPVISSALAWQFFGEVPPPLSFLGALLVLSGIYHASAVVATNHGR